MRDIHDVTEDKRSNRANYNQGKSNFASVLFTILLRRKLSNKIDLKRKYVNIYRKVSQNDLIEQSWERIKNSHVQAISEY